MSSASCVAATCTRCGCQALETGSVQCTVCKSAPEDFALDPQSYSSIRSLSHFSKCRPMSAWTSRNLAVMMKLHNAAVLTQGVPGNASISWTQPTGETCDAFLRVAADGSNRLFARCTSASGRFPFVIHALHLLHPVDPQKDKSLGDILVIAPNDYFSNDRVISGEVLAEHSLLGSIYLAVKLPETADAKAQRRYRRL